MWGFLLYSTIKVIKPGNYHLSFRLSIILLLAGDISINPGPKTFQNMRFATTNVRSVRHKSAALSDLILSKHIDILALTETWLLASDTSACLADICPNGFCLYHHPRRSGRGGGVAFLVPEIYKVEIIHTPQLRQRQVKRVLYVSSSAQNSRQRQLQRT